MGRTAASEISTGPVLVDLRGATVFLARAQKTSKINTVQ